MAEILAHCNECGGDRRHELLYAEEFPWTGQYDDSITGGEKFEVLRCRGCRSPKLRRTVWSSEDQGNEVAYYPAAVFRPPPHWYGSLLLDLPVDAWFVNGLLGDVYTALHNGSYRLAAMGVRALLEQIMISQVGDHGTFAKNLKEFAEKGFVSRIQREKLEPILEAGHAAIHRDYVPTATEVITLVNLAEHIIESIFLHGAEVDRLKKRIPARRPRGTT